MANLYPCPGCGILHSETQPQSDCINCIAKAIVFEQLLPYIIADDESRSNIFGDDSAFHPAPGSPPPAYFSAPGSPSRSSSASSALSPAGRASSEPRTLPDPCDPRNRYTYCITIMINRRPSQHWLQRQRNYEMSRGAWPCPKRK